jgi:hypothetical protein
VTVLIKLNYIVENKFNQFWGHFVIKNQGFHYVKMKKDFIFKSKPKNQSNSTKMVKLPKPKPSQTESKRKASSSSSSTCPVPDWEWKYVWKGKQKLAFTLSHQKMVLSPCFGGISIDYCILQGAYCG